MPATPIAAFPSTLRRWATAWLLATGALGAAAASTAPATVADCDGPHEQVLQAALPMPADYTAARAAWLDGGQLRWAGAPAHGPHRYRLHHSRQGPVSFKHHRPHETLSLIGGLGVVL
jgi:hypothetical protein